MEVLATDHVGKLASGRAKHPGAGQTASAGAGPGEIRQLGGQNLDAGRREFGDVPSLLPREPQGLPEALAADRPKRHGRIVVLFSEDGPGRPHDGGRGQARRGCAMGVFSHGDLSSRLLGLGPRRCSTTFAGRLLMQDNVFI